MKQSRHLNASEETGTGCPVTSKNGRAHVTYLTNNFFCPISAYHVSLLYLH